MKQVGDAFRSKRKERNLSLKEVENATSIRMNYIQAIEEGDLERLISPVYAQGFVKQYANYLGFDGDKIIKDHPEIFSRKEEQEFAYGIGTLESRKHAPSHSTPMTTNLLWGGAFLLLFTIAYFFARFLEVI